MPFAFTRGSLTAMLNVARGALPPGTLLPCGIELLPWEAQYWPLGHLSALLVGASKTAGLALGGCAAWIRPLDGLLTSLSIFGGGRSWLAWLCACVDMNMRLAMTLCVCIQYRDTSFRPAMLLPSGMRTFVS